MRLHDETLTMFTIKPSRIISTLHLRETNIANIMNIKNFTKQESFKARSEARPKQCVEDDVARWCNPLTLQSEQSGGVASIPGRTPTLSVMTRDRGLD